MWNQTFVYSGLRRADLRLRALEITVWDYVRYGANDFLGEAIVELWPLDEQPTWRQLVPHEEVCKILSIKIQHVNGDLNYS